MKKYAYILATVVGMALPLAAQAGPADNSSTHAKKATAQAQPRSTAVHRTYYYITKDVPTGSFIPIVIRRSGNDTSSLSPLTSYSRLNLDRTGSDDLASELVRVDPALSLRR